LPKHLPWSPSGNLVTTYFWHRLLSVMCSLCFVKVSLHVLTLLQSC
jgi:hypothetical protein